MRDFLGGIGATAVSMAFARGGVSALSAGVVGLRRDRKPVGPIPRAGTK